MTASPVAFDLDGTLSDSSEGITRSINYALIRLGRDPLPKKQLLQYIGPRITDIFQDLLGAVAHATIMESPSDAATDRIRPREQDDAGCPAPQAMRRRPVVAALLAHHMEQCIL